MSNFYRMFAAYYNTIFPLAGGKEEFFKNSLKNYGPKTALDLGCATGELTGLLTEKGCETTGVDLSQSLLDLASGQPGQFILADMVEYIETKPQEKKDLIICIGNTLPHLEPTKLERFIDSIPTWLNENGLMVIQTVNYHKILANRPPGLPTIERPEAGIKFSRLYSYNPDGSIAFTAVLDSPEGRDRSAVTLWPYTAEDIKHRLSESFRIEAEYGSFKETPYDSDQSSAWVLVARKRN